MKKDTNKKKYHHRQRHHQEKNKTNAKMGEEMHVVTYLTGILPETGAFLKVSKEKQTSLPSAIDHSLTHRSRCYKHTAQCTNWNVLSRPLRLWTWIWMEWLGQRLNRVTMKILTLTGARSGVFSSHLCYKVSRRGRRTGKKADVKSWG